MNRILRTAISLALTAPLLNATPAHAANDAEVSFVGNFTVSVPCVECHVLFTATLTTGTVEMTDPPSHGVVTGLTASMRMTEPGDCVEGVNTSAGTARGTMTLSGVNVVGVALPYTLAFDWLRLGTVAVFNPPGSAGWVTFNPPPPCSGTWQPTVTGYFHTN